MTARRYIVGDALEVLRTLPDEYVQCVVTSPPYWSLRDYNSEGQNGLEKTPEAYVEKLVEVFREVRRVLRSDGTLWLNLGDSYANSRGTGASPLMGDKQASNPGSHLGRKIVPDGLKDKDLVGVPWRVAFALQADGWWLRSDIIWAKKSPMPESVTDRPTKAHEYIFLLTKSARYFYDQEAVKEKAVKGAVGSRFDTGKTGNNGNGRAKEGYRDKDPTRRNLRSVWTMATQPYKQAHFATFPELLPKRCILAGTSERGCCPECGAPWERVVERNNPSKEYNTGDDERYSGMENMGGNHQTVNGLHRNNGGVYSSAKTIGFRPTCECGRDDTKPCIVLDPFGGSGTVGRVAEDLGRDWICIDLNPDYKKLADVRTAQGGLRL